MEPAAVVKDEPEDDFFTSWSKPNTPKSSNPGTPRVSTPPVIGRANSFNSTANPSPPSAPAPAPPSRILTSSAATRQTRLGANQSRLNSANSAAVTTSTVKKSKLGLGASKTKPVDFAEAERKAREEEEKIKQLGYDREREETEERLRKEVEALKLTQDLPSNASMNSRDVGTTHTGDKIATFTSNPQKSAAFPRLGFGAIPGAGAAAAVAAASAATSRKTTTGLDDSPTTARDKFGSQKAISSDMFFGRGNYDTDQVREAQTRLQTFQGATSISSNQYFGRDEEDALSREEIDGGLLGDGSLAGIESAAKDAISKVLANPDVQNIGESIRAGALKVKHVIF